MIFLGPYYSPKEEKQLLSHSKRSLSNATNQFQTDLLCGLLDNNADLKIINVLPVGTFPKHFNKLFLENKKWEFDGCDCTEVGGINLPVLKQWQREFRVRRLLNKMVKVDNEIIIYSTYLPFLRAIRCLPKSVKITLIIADLPEFYDLGKTTGVRNILRKINNRFIYKCFSRINGYVLLTEQMADFLKIKDKPYTVVEGVWNEKKNEVSTLTKSDKKVIFYAGALYRKFGIIKLLEAFELIEDPDVELWLCGSGDIEKEILERSEQDKRIKFFGYVSSEKAEELRKSATVLVNPRTNEGEYTKYSFPSKTMGYLASGIPIVAYKLDGIPDEYDEYMNLIKGHKIEDLKEKLCEVLYDTEDVYLKKAKEAIDFLNTKKTAKIQAKKIIDLMNAEE